MSLSQILGSGRSPFKWALDRSSSYTNNSDTIKISVKKLRKKKQKVAASKAFSIKNAQGQVTYRVVKYDKRAKKKISVSKSGKIVVKKKLKAGKYKVKVRIEVAGNAGYLPLAKIVSLKVRVRG